MSELCAFDLLLLLSAFHNPTAHIAAAGWLTCITVAAQLIAAAMCSELRQEAANWQQLQWPCLDETNAAMCLQAVSDIHCFTRFVQEAGDLVAQWRSDTGVCCAFHYTSKCADWRVQLQVELTHAASSEDSA